MDLRWLLLALAVIGCAAESPREKSLESERDTAKKQLEQKNDQYFYDMRFSERYHELTAAREAVWYATNVYLVTDNNVLSVATQTENREALQKVNDSIGKKLATLNIRLREFRIGPPESEAYIKAAKELTDLAQAVQPDLDAAVAKTKEIKDAERANLESAVQSLTEDRRALAALNYTTRDSALDLLVKNYEAIKSVLPRVVCAAFSSNCRE